MKKIETTTSCNMISSLRPGQRPSQRHALRSNFLAAVFLLSSLSPLLHAEQEGDFKYSSDGSAITITKYTGNGEMVTIPDKVAGLPVRTIGTGYERIGEATLTSVTIPSSVTSIKGSAFYGMGLTKVTIPPSVTSIAGSFVGNCTHLTAIIVDPANPSYRSVDGVLLSKDGTTLVQYPGGKAGNYTIPATVTNVGNGAFSRCASLTGIMLPSGVTNIGGYAFEHCTGLTAVTIPASIVTIGRGAFSKCSAVTNIAIQGGLTKIEASTFSGCTGLIAVAIPPTVTSIGVQAFMGCAGLPAVRIPSSVTSMDQNTFMDCRSLVSATFEGSAPSVVNADGKESPPFMISSNLFKNASPGFIIRYFKGAAGFTTPEWNGYKTVEIDPATELFDWTSKDSKIIKANFVKLDGEVVVVRTEDGKEHKIPFTRLSPASIAQAKMLDGGSR